MQRTQQTEDQMPDYATVTEEREEQCVNRVLRLFVDYVNAWWNKDFPDELDPYSVETFTVTDPERQLYGSTGWSYWEQDEYCYFEIDADSGDDGGSSTLLACFSPDGDWELKYVVQTFDTIPCMIYTNEDGMRKPK